MRHDFPGTLKRFPHKIEPITAPWGRACVFCLCLGMSNGGREYWQGKLNESQAARLDEIIRRDLQKFYGRFTA